MSLTRTASFGFVAALSVAVAACGQKETPKPVASATPSASAAPSAEPPVTVERYEQLLTALSDCKLDRFGIDPRCPQLDALRKAQSKREVGKQLQDFNAKVAPKLLTHVAAPVRFQAARLLGPMIAARKEVRDALVAASKNETNSTVQVGLVRVLGARVGEDAEIAEQLTKLADAPEGDVRREAMSWFLTRYAEKGRPGFEKVLAHVESDPDSSVRSFLCSRLYGSEDERALPVFEKVLKDPKSSAELVAGCWSGLLKAWTGFPLPEKPQKRAWELTLDVLKAKPRSADKPPRSGIHTLSAARSDFPERDTRGRAWLEKVKPWFDKEKLVSALEDVVTDDAAHWQARTSAASVMMQLGAGKARFEAILKKLPQPKPPAPPAAAGSAAAKPSAAPSSSAAPQPVVDKDGDLVRVRRSVERIVQHLDLKAKAPATAASASAGRAPGLVPPPAASHDHGHH